MILYSMAFIGPSFNRHHASTVARKYPFLSLPKDSNHNTIEPHIAEVEMTKTPESVDVSKLHFVIVAYSARSPKRSLLRQITPGTSHSSTTSFLAKEARRIQSTTRLSRFKNAPEENIGEENDTYSSLGYSEIIWSSPSQKVSNYLFALRRWSVLGTYCDHRQGSLRIQLPFARTGRLFERDRV